MSTGKKQQKGKKEKEKRNKENKIENQHLIYTLVISMPQMVIIQNAVSNDNPRLRAAALLNPLFVL